MRIHPTILLVVLAISCGIVKVLGNFSSSQQTDILNGMNAIRANVSPASATPLRKLEWSGDLATNALNLANLCGSSYMSANGAAGVFSESVLTFDSEPNGEMVVNALSIAKEGYNYDDNLCYDGVDCMAYTNMIWERSTQVGCSKADCGTQANGGSLRWRVVCNWNPAGSFPGVQPYIAVTHESKSLLNTDPNYGEVITFKSNGNDTNKALLGTSLIQESLQSTSKFLKSKSKISSADFDYRQNGIVPVPVDSLNCNAAYAFVAAAIAQSRVAMKTGVRPTVSVQQMIDCMYTNSPPIGGVRASCVNGSIHDALVYIRDFGLMKENDYKYVGASTDGICKYDANKVIIKGGDMQFSESGKEHILSQARSDGPVGVAINADINLFDYRAGVYSCPTYYGANSTNHAVLLVGYNKEQDYYIVRNNWGTQWGENGFARITGDPNHDCGISANLAATMHGTKTK